ncbi:MAG: hypothetical protein U9N40_08690 [Euryarchaeota archaeon]|nr:hypothetical protein [Euryarchaeota archaeon]
MKCKAGLALDCTGPFHRYLEDCGIQCELITPQILGAPFFRGRLVTMVIPTGFGNRMYSNILPALKASSGRTKKFVEKGGRILIFGAMSTNEDCYDWLPFPVTYNHEYFNTPVTIDRSSLQCEIIDDYDEKNIDCDGYFTEFDGVPIIKTEDGKVVMFCKESVRGMYLITSLHEYPSKKFISSFCTAGSETLF